MALVLRSNPSRLSSGVGALFVSNPRKRKPSRKVRRNAKKKTVSRKRKNPVRKRKKVAKRPVRRNALKVKRNPVRKRKVATKKRVVRKNALMVRKNALRVKRRNPSRRRKATKRLLLNPLKMLRKNPRKILPSIVASSKRMISRIPYVGKPIAENLPMAVSGMVGGLAFAYGYKKFSEMLAQQSALRPDSQLLNYTNKLDKWAGLALIGVAIKVLSKSKLAEGFLGKETSSMVGNGAVYVGGALQAVRLFNMWAESKGKATVQLESQSSTTATSGLMYGDGGSYDVVPLSGVHQMGMMHGMHRNPMHRRNAMHGFYSDAKPADAVMTSSDLSPQEARSAMVGNEHSYAQSFEQVPVRLTNTDIYSCYAGKHGHRWGWMIKMIGFDRFQKLAMLPPVKRVQLIAKMKESAIQSAQQTFDKAEDSGYSLDMSGLSIDAMSGLAVVGTAV